MATQTIEDYMDYSRDLYGAISDNYSKKDLERIHHDSELNNADRTALIVTENARIDTFIQSQQPGNAYSITGMRTEFNNRRIDIASKTVNQMLGTPALRAPIYNSLPMGFTTVPPAGPPTTSMFNPAFNDITSEVLLDGRNDYARMFKKMYNKESRMLVKDKGYDENLIDALLYNACGSMSNWPVIDPKSSGLGDINQASNLFNKYYFLEYNKPVPGGGAALQAGDIVPSDFYKSFIKRSGFADFYDTNQKLNAAASTARDTALEALGFKRTMTYLEFDPELWYNKDDETTANIAASAGAFTKTGIDSFGVFFKSRQPISPGFYANPNSVKAPTAGAAVNADQSPDLVNINTDVLHNTLHEELIDPVTGTYRNYGILRAGAAFGNPRGAGSDQFPNGLMLLQTADTAAGPAGAPSTNISAKTYCMLFNQENNVDIPEADASRLQKRDDSFILLTDDQRLAALNTYLTIPQQYLFNTTNKGVRFLKNDDGNIAAIRKVTKNPGGAIAQGMQLDAVQHVYLTQSGYWFSQEDMVNGQASDWFKICKEMRTLYGMFVKIRINAINAALIVLDGGPGHAGHATVQALEAAANNSLAAVVAAALTVAGAVGGLPADPGAGGYFTIAELNTLITAEVAVYGAMSGLTAALGAANALAAAQYGPVKATFLAAYDGYVAQLFTTLVTGRTGGGGGLPAHGTAPASIQFNPAGNAMLFNMTAVTGGPAGTDIFTDYFSMSALPAHKDLVIGFIGKYIIHMLSTVPGNPTIDLRTLDLFNTAFTSITDPELINQLYLHTQLASAAGAVTIFELNNTTIGDDLVDLNANKIIYSLFESVLLVGMRKFYEAIRTESVAANRPNPYIFGNDADKVRIGGQAKFTIGRNINVTPCNIAANVQIVPIPNPNIGNHLGGGGRSSSHSDKHKKSSSSKSSKSSKPSKSSKSSKPEKISKSSSKSSVKSSSKSSIKSLAKPISKSKSRSKIQKGGTFDNLFDSTTKPLINAKRKLKLFNSLIFLKSARRFNSEFDNDGGLERIRDILDKIYDMENLPIIYHNKSDTRKFYRKTGGEFAAVTVNPTGRLSFEEIRSLFLFTSVTTNSIRLLLNFFTNIKACLLYFLANDYQTIIAYMQGAGAGSDDTDSEYFEKYKKGVEGLISNIDSMINYLTYNTPKLTDKTLQCDPTVAFGGQEPFGPANTHHVANLFTGANLFFINTNGVGTIAKLYTDSYIRFFRNIGLFTNGVSNSKEFVNKKNKSSSFLNTNNFIRALKSLSNGNLAIQDNNILAAAAAAAAFVPGSLFPQAIFTFLNTAHAVPAPQLYIHNYRNSSNSCLGGIPFTFMQSKRCTYLTWATFMHLLYLRIESAKSQKLLIGAVTKDMFTEITKPEKTIIDTSVKQILRDNQELQSVFMQRTSWLDLRAAGRMNLIEKSVNTLLLIYYNRSNAIAKKIEEIYKTSKQQKLNPKLKQVKQTIGIRRSNIFTKSVKKSNEQELLDKLTEELANEFKIDKEIEKFKTEIDMVIEQIKRHTKFQYSTQLQFIEGHLRNYHFRLNNLKLTLNLKDDNKVKAKILNYSGFNQVHLNMSNTKSFHYLKSVGVMDLDYQQPDWWAHIDNQFMNKSSILPGANLNTSSNVVNRLFIIAVTGGIRKDIYLMDALSLAKHFSDNTLDLTTGQRTHQKIRTIMKGNKEFYSPRNFIRKLTGVGKYVEQQHLFTSLPKRTAAKPEVTRSDIIKKDLVPDDLQKLINCEYYIDHNGEEKRLEPLFLQADSKITLKNIINANNPFQEVMPRNNEYRVYKITDSDIEDLKKFRKWLYDVLYSLPTDMSSFSGVDNSNFAKTEKPVSKEFTITGGRTHKLGNIMALLDYINPKSIDTDDVVINAIQPKYSQERREHLKTLKHLKRQTLIGNHGPNTINESNNAKQRLQINGAVRGDLQSGAQKFGNFIDRSSVYQLIR